MTHPGAAMGRNDLISRYAGIVCDLDGVVYAGRGALPHAVDALEEVRSRGIGVVYATNNGSRPPEDVGAHLAELGLTIVDGSVVTSAQAAAARLRDELGDGAPVLAVGGPGVPLALQRVGLRVVTPAEAAAGQPARGVLQSFGPLVSWTDLAEAAHAVNSGALWVASNADMTLPTARGVAPGNGSLVAVVRAAVSHGPVVVGKPETPLYELSANVLGTAVEATLAIGDRIDTDIVGAARAGIDALLVFSGISTVADAVTMATEHRPRYLAWDLRALTQPYDEPHVATPAGPRNAVAVTCGETEATVRDGVVALSEAGTPDQRLRAAVAAAWVARDAGLPVDPQSLHPALAPGA